MSRNKTTILIADDHVLVRIGLRSLIDAQPDLEVVAEAEDGEEAIRLARKHRPDVAVVDLMMPVTDGAEATRRIAAELPQTKVMILTSYTTSADLVRAVSAGAAGAKFKGTSAQNILDAIRAIARGETAIDDEVLRMMNEEPEPCALTARQAEILHSVTRGLTTTDIAKQYGITPSCVKHHITHVCSKLGASNRSEAVTIALRRHLLKI
jgi:DNA-binding NarL/FixJ family response regulator